MVNDRLNPNGNRRVIPEVDFMRLPPDPVGRIPQRNYVNPGGNINRRHARAQRGRREAGWGNLRGGLRDVNNQLQESIARIRRIQDRARRQVAMNADLRERRQEPAPGPAVDADLWERRQAPAPGPAVNLGRRQELQGLIPHVEVPIRALFIAGDVQRQAPAAGPEPALRAAGPAHFRRRMTPAINEVIGEVDYFDGSADLEQHVPHQMQLEPQITAELSEKVFENDMLREMILRQVIFSTGKVSVPDLRSIRLVRKSWLTAAVDIFSSRKLRLPMFNLTLDSANSTNESQYFQRHGSKLLDTFVRSMASPTSLPQCIPPFKLHLNPDFFLKENHKNLSDCLVSCGEALVHLDLSFPYQNTMTLAFPPFSLPQLKRLSIQFSDYGLMGVFENHNFGHSIYPLQTFINAAPDLHEITLKHNSHDFLIPFGFEYLNLPQTLTKLSLEGLVKNVELQMVINNDLPNLTSLELYAPSFPDSDQMIFQVLDKFQKSLKILTLEGDKLKSRLRIPIRLRFPVMEKLEVVTFASQCWEFEGNPRQLEHQLPKLMELKMKSIKGNILDNWIQGSRFPEVSKLSISVTDGMRMTENFDYVEVPLIITTEKMQALHLTFPNVVTLELTMSWGSKAHGLKHLFREMVSLENLSITLKTTVKHHNPSQWDALFIGVPQDMAECFRKNPGYWDNVNLKVDPKFPSIRNLTALKSLSLVDISSGSGRFPRSRPPLISDLSFHFAFLKMPNLTKILFHGKFSPSTQMRRQWFEEKGTHIGRFHRG